LIRDLAKWLLPKRMQRRILRSRRRILLRSQRRKACPPLGAVSLGSLRRTTPISNSFGFDRGQPIDRYYIEDFLRRHGEALGVIRGRVLEIQEPLYAQQFGDEPRIERIDVLDVDPGNPYATVVADLTDAPDLASNAFDCIICTQTLLLIYDVQAAVATLHRILKPGGTALVTVPGISQICHPPNGHSLGDYWRFTTMSAQKLFDENFHPADITVEVYGSVLSAAAFLYGLAAEDLTPAELEVRDPEYQLIIGVKATKASRPSIGTR
jgi:SAM-dependent methyltransferase